MLYPTLHLRTKLSPHFTVLEIATEILIALLGGDTAFMAARTL